MDTPSQCFVTGSIECGGWRLSLWTTPWNSSSLSRPHSSTGHLIGNAEIWLWHVHLSHFRNQCEYFKFTLIYKGFVSHSGDSFSWCLFFPLSLSCIGLLQFFFFFSYKLFDQLPVEMISTNQTDWDDFCHFSCGLSESVKHWHHISTPCVSMKWCNKGCVKAFLRVYQDLH